ncbi:hypothetical protein ER57_00530 [Smithella sp. SCADC]|jgi:hypothetical protein|nr:hypothetical protein ER57_00530 [Smithella sp. SCADC]
MLNSFALVKKLNSNSDQLIFNKFRLSKISCGDNSTLKEAQRLFSKAWVSYGDWIYKRQYEDIEDRIPFDVEGTLLLLRLYKTGDLFFVQPCIEKADGNLSCQLPYPVMVSTTTTQRYELNIEECSSFDAFASEIVSQENWSSTWFQTARRFFLYGGGKEHNPAHDQLYRIVDYMTALEATLVPESDFVGRRLRERAVKLINGIELDAQKRLLRDFYGVRSTVVHGSKIDSKQRDILKNIADFETIVRNVLVSALRTIPSNDVDRQNFLEQLFPICDQTRAEQVFNDFCKIKDKYEKENCFKKISKRIPYANQ